jgi:hypothetical protein
MSMDARLIDAYADLGGTWLDDQTARIRQMHLQFGQRCRVDVDALVARAASLSRSARSLATPRVHHHLSAALGKRSPGATGDCAQLFWRGAVGVAQVIAGEKQMQFASAPKRRCVAGPATLGEFGLGNRLGDCSPCEWMAVLSDSTEVVVPDVQGAPSSLAIEKAVSIVQSRSYLEKRARQLLKSFTANEGNWRLVTLDFGVAAMRHECEFLMCFAFESTNGELSITSRYVEIGFSLAVQIDEDPLFILTIRSAIGFST